ncbi:TniQ family protein [Pseudomonas sp. lyk4-R2A-10]|uniref:TniQ family protein n=1 Tax=Pseudomonas sp. lyk4-R2A-10 TaxID=3040315 RepID=UPI002553E564|nr:TniQ family protein [Pseudomonas sp. lyk4-R2A-10]
MILPVHPQPCQGELLSSWMVRLAFSNVFALHTFYFSLLECKAPIWSRDIDRHPPRALLDVLKNHTHQSELAIQSMTLSYYEGMLFETLPVFGDAIWLLPAGVYHRTRRREGMQFCPLCLLGDSEPYYRRAWRLAIYTVCREHQCLMLRHCPYCESPVAFHRHGMGWLKSLAPLSLRLCHQCGFDLGMAQPTQVKWPYAQSRELMCGMLNMLEANEWSGWPLSICSSLSFFNGLRILLGVIGGRHGERVRAVLNERIGVRFDIEPNRDFEYQSTIRRFNLLAAGLWLTSDWPSRFLEVFKEARFTRSRFDDSLRMYPYWLQLQVSLHLDTRPYLPSYEEIEAAANYLLITNIGVCTDSLGALMGIKRDVARRAVGLWKDSRRGTL